MKTSKVFFINLFVIGLSNFSIAQIIKPFPEGLGIEVGGGYNQLKWHINSSIYAPEKDYSRQEFYITPTVHLKYQIYPYERIQLTVFSGYSRFGGKSKEQSDGYKDEIWFDALEAGLLTAYSFETVEIGGGFKYNHLYKIFQNHYGYVGQTSNRIWEKTDIDFFFKRDLYHLGLRVSLIYYYWNVSAESWFGINQIESDGLRDAINVHSNHFRLLLGYSL